MAFLQSLLPKQRETLNKIIGEAGLEIDSFDFSDSVLTGFMPGHTKPGYRWRYLPHPDFYFVLHTSYLDANICECSPSTDGFGQYEKKSVFGDTNQQAWEQIEEMFRAWVRCVADQFGTVIIGSPNTSGIRVIGIKNGTPWSSHLELEEMFANCSGVIRACDPYYGQRSLQRIMLFKNANNVKFLTVKPDSKEKVGLPAILQDFKAEHKDVEIRQHAGNDIHDRYILSDEGLILLGHGLKDIGKRDSFVVSIEKNLAGDLIKELEQSFDQKWNAAKVLV